MKRKLLALVLTFSATVTLFSCGKTLHEHQGTFYGLREAYENGLLTVNDLHEIKDEMTNNTLTINKKITRLIKKDYFALLQEKEIEEKTKTPYRNINISKYYGEYNASYVVIITHAYIVYPAIGYIEFIDEVQFLTGEPPIQVWHKDK